MKVVAFVSGSFEMLLDEDCQLVVSDPVCLRDIDRPAHSAHIADNPHDRQSISAFARRNLNMHAVLDLWESQLLSPVEKGSFYPSALFI